MTDFWSFLLQTLTASSAAIFVLAAKAMFRDKLSLRWQFASWGLVGLALLIPAGISGRYAFVDLPFFVETIKSVFTGQYGTLTKVVAPIPLPFFPSEDTVFQWVYIVYAAGTVFFLVRYIVLYIRLRHALRRIEMETRPKENRRKEELQEQIDFTAKKYGLFSCPVLEVEGLESAFVCGVFHPVLVLPKKEVDEKIILHELLHLRYGDVLWGLVICLFRCLHWCNPLLWMCADLAGNDLESLCDQRVLERISGEERRDYGNILLDMAGGRYAKTPGTSSIANGSKNIRQRIMAIARFKKYPTGMGFVSICILMLFSMPFLVGTKPMIASEKGSLLLDNNTACMARARTIRCTTYAGAFDTYAKAVLTGNIPYLAMCAPLDKQNLLAAAYKEGREISSLKNLDLPGLVDIDSGYQIYNVIKKQDTMYEGLLVLKLLKSSEKQDLNENKTSWLAVQYVCAEKQNGRWVVFPKDKFSTVIQEKEWSNALPDNHSLPAWHYRANTKNFLLQMRWQTVSSVESFKRGNKNGIWSSHFDPTPQPDGIFSTLWGYQISAVYTGTSEEKSLYTQVGHSGYVVWDETEKQNSDRSKNNSSSKNYRNESLNEVYGSSSDGSSFSSRPLKEGWNDEIRLGGGGSNGKMEPPKCYVIEFYLNNKLEDKLTLEPVEGSGIYER